MGQKFSTNQIAGFFNQPYIQKKSMKSSDFLHVDPNSHKLKVQKWMGLHWSQVPKIGCISRKN